MNLNWQHLTYFKSVAEFENFSKAADELYVTASAVSKAVNNLEDVLGFPLFEKQGRNSVLTEYGKIFYRHVSEAFRCIDEGISEVNQMRSTITGRINVGGIYTMCAEFLPVRIKGFVSEYPEVSFSMEYHITDQILDSVLSNTIDLGFCGNFDVNSPRYSQIEKALLFTEPLVIIVSDQHPLAGQESVDFSTLENESFIIHRNHNSGTTPLFEHLCQSCGFRPRISFEVPDDQSILGLVKADLGIALIADAPSLKIPGVAVIPLRYSAPARDQYMIWRKDRTLSPAASAFRSYILSDLRI